MNWRSPLVIIAAYAIAVVAFALLYAYLLTPDFYHPYVKFEETVKAEKVRFERALEAAIVSQLEHSADLGKGVRFELSQGCLIRGEQDATSGDLLTASYAVAMSLSKDDEQQLFFVTIPIVIAPFGLKNYQKKEGLILPPGDKTGVPGFKTGGETGTIYIARDPQRTIEDHTILPHKAEDVATVANAVVKIFDGVTLSTEQRILGAQIIEADQGFPSELPGNFWRMLYFSAITITTVGYGDIVPLTGPARFFAAVEATLGIVLLGLFINSLASDRTAKR